jgi:hypothetical protein
MVCEPNFHVLNVGKPKTEKLKSRKYYLLGLLGGTTKNESKHRKILNQASTLLWCVLMFVYPVLIY